MNHNILLLGSGLVTEPLIKYLLEISGVRLTIATLELEKAQNILKGHPNGVAVYLDAGNDDELDALIKTNDLAISLLPAPMHPRVARFCLKHSRNLITASYVSPAMKALDEEAKASGVLFLNELGLDPGIDHMSAMRVIHHVENNGGKITGFRSYCGGLPAPEANTNPLGYKFSWAPRGVFVAATNSARYLWDGTIVEIPGKSLFHKFETLKVQDFTFEAYPNRDSLPYVEIYGLKNAQTMFRGTLRYPGWCHILKTLVNLGYLDQTEQTFEVRTYAELARLIAGKETGNPIELVAKKAGLPLSDPAIRAMDWLALFSDDALRPDLPTILDHFAQMCMEKMQFLPGERDMVVLHHIFDADIEGKHRTITSSLIDFGIPGGYSAMARTVSLPAAIGAKLIIQGKIPLTGVQIPVSPSIYQPILSELESLNIRCIETGL